jgi:hypothetical protein
MKTKSSNRKGAREGVANARRLSMLDQVLFAATLSPGLSGGHERIEEFNASLLVESSFSEPLTEYAVGFREPDLDAELEFFAPEVPVGRRFEYATADSDEEFLSDNDDDLRAIRADFPEVEYTGNKVDASTKNRGLQITIDLDEVQGRPDWEEYYTQKLIRRLKRNALRRAVALLSAAATNTAKTWDTTAGKDPDQDVITDLITGANARGVKSNRVGYGDTAWAKRALAHRAQDSAGGFASASLTEEALAALLGVDQVLRSNGRYTSAASTKTEIVANLVLMFSASAGMDTEDPSNIKRFVSMGNPEEGGGRFQVYSQRLSAKRHVIAVGHYELLKITSTLGIRKFTVS